jgi:hypothetical protein
LQKNIIKTVTGKLPLFFIMCIFAAFILAAACTSNETSPTAGNDVSAATPVKSTPTRGEPVELNMQFKWDKKAGAPGVLTAYGTTNLPDGAGLRGCAWEGINPSYMNSKFAGGDDAAIVKDGKFTCSVKLYDSDVEKAFTDNSLLFELSFMPSATLLQPQSVTEYYDRGSLLKIKSGSLGFISKGPPAMPEEKILYYQAFVTSTGNSVNVREVKDYFKGQY